MDNTEALSVMLKGIFANTSGWSKDLKKLKKLSGAMGFETWPPTCHAGALAAELWPQ